MIATLQAILMVALGSALGGTLRYAVSGFVGRRIGETFPWGTLVVNVSGAFTIGLLAATVFARQPDHGSGWHLLVTGVLGSYTTVSSFSLQTLALAREGEVSRALANIGLSLGFCLSAAAIGLAAGAALSGTAAA